MARPSFFQATARGPSDVDPDHRSAVPTATPALFTS